MHGYGHKVVIKKHGFDADGQYTAVVQVRGIRLGSTCPQSAGWYTDKKERKKFLKYMDSEGSVAKSHMTDGLVFYG